jgi:hypothetical protein
MSLIKDGRYEVTLATIIGTTTGAVDLHGGQFSGQTRLGTRLFGTYDYVPDRGVHRYECTAEIGPSGFTFLGIPFGGFRRSLVSRGEATATDGEIRFSASIVGRAVDVAMRYVSPLAGAG